MPAQALRVIVLEDDPLLRERVLMPGLTDHGFQVNDNQTEQNVALVVHEHGETDHHRGHRGREQERAEQQPNGHAKANNPTHSSSRPCCAGMTTSTEVLLKILCSKTF
jgi:hypothetical protein